MKPMSILFLAKEKPFAKDAAEIVRQYDKKADIVFGKRGDKFPSHIASNRYDYVLSYVSPWIVTEQLLKNVRVASINFHPGPPEYPGIGCTNFAIYNEEKQFGVTVHHMEPKVDTGDIIAVERFSIFDNDTVYTLTQRCYAYIYISFIKTFSLIISNKPLPKSEECWRRKPFTRRELNELCEITKDMPDDEVKRRVKSTVYPEMPGAFIELAGIRFIAESEPVINNKGER